MEEITARQNPLILSTVKLKDKKHRRESGLFCFEGEKLLRDAMAAGVAIEYLLLTKKGYERLAGTHLPFRCILVSDAVYDKISEENSPCGIFCVAKHLDFLHKRYIIYGSENFSGTKFLISELRDPGNLGTVLRTANALGIDEVLLSADCADLYNSKVIRSAMGALFRQRVSICEDLASSIDALRANGYTVLGAALHRNSKNLRDITVDARTCFLIGNEGHGLSDALLSHCDDSVWIPMAEGAESLNAASAATVLLWELQRTR